jgi:hypothetical protein
MMNGKISRRIVLLSSLTLLSLGSGGCRDFDTFEPCTVLSCGDNGRCIVRDDGRADCSCDDDFESNGLWCRSGNTPLEAIYVDPSSTTEPRDGSKTAPFAELVAAIEAAQKTSVKLVIVGGAPTFEGGLTLAEGVSIKGGHTAGPTFEVDTALRPTIIAGPSTSKLPLVAVTAVGILEETFLSGFRVEALGLEGEATAPGADRYGIRVERSPGLRLYDLIVVAGSAGNGADGDAGVEGAGGDTGDTSSDEETEATACSSPSTVTSTGGTGGNACPGDSNDGGRGGDASAPATTNPGSNGGGDGGGAGGLVGAPGAPGASHSEPAATGTGGVVSGETVDGFWRPLAEATGSVGDRGLNGGGGGGGGSGTPRNIDGLCSSGTGGGGGGAGGCGGGGGQGGYPGGTSFGIFVASSTGLVVRDCAFLGGNGGNGGRGGAGGSGGAGGAGAPSADCMTSGCSRGGDGGDGGNGQTGGDGGGGAGGSSYGGFCDTALVMEGSVHFTHSEAGDGGGSGESVGDDGLTFDEIGCAP